MRRETARERLLASGMGCCLFALCATLINVLALPYARERFGYPMAGTLAAFALSLAALCALSRALARAGEERCARIARAALPAFLAALFVVQVLLGYLMAYTPEGDNHHVLESAKMLASQGFLSPDSDYPMYLSRFSNQWGFVLLLSGLFRLFAVLGVGDAFFALAVLQAALYVPGMLAAAGIARRLGGARCVLALLALLACCAPLYLAAAVLYTDTFSLPFILITLRFALAALDAKTLRARLGWALLAALTATLGAQIKMTAYIALTAAGIVWLLAMRAREGLPCAALAACVVLAGTLGVQGYMTAHVLDAGMVERNHTPAAHWVMMSIPTAKNPYGGATGDYGETWGLMEQGATREEVMDSILARMKDRIYTLRYPSRLLTAALRKNAASTGDGTFGMTEMLDDGPVRENAFSAFVLEDRPYYRAYGAAATGVYLAAMALAAAGCAGDIRRRDLRAGMLYTAMFGIQLFLMLWEARSRYLFGFVPVLLLLSAKCVARGEAKA